MKRQTRYNKTPTQFYYINNRINVEEMRVIDAKGEQVGVMQRAAALDLAREQGFDLVLIAPKANPPVAKITDFKKFLYTQEKKLKEAKKGAKKSGVKDIQLSLFIGPADFDRMISKGKEFIDEGNQVRINLTLRGREVVKRAMALELMNKYIAQLGDINISKEPRVEGRVVRAVLSKKK